MKSLQSLRLCEVEIGVCVCVCNKTELEHFFYFNVTEKPVSENYMYLTETSNNYYVTCVEGMQGSIILLFSKV